MNKHLFDLLKRIEDSARRLASTITHNADLPMRDVRLVQTELDEITNALEAFKSEVAAGASIGYIGGRLIKKGGS
jgi:hypothetical protein